MKKAAKISGISGYNFGDYLLSECITFILNKQSISHINYNLYPIVSHTIQSDSPKKGRIKNAIGKIKWIIYLILIFRTLKNFSYYKNIAKNHSEIFYGGGNLVSNDDGSNYLFICFLMAILTPKKKLNLSFVGVGPFSFYYKMQLNYIQKKSNKIIVRDQYSKQFFQNNDVVVLPDPALITANLFPITNNIEKNKLLINLIDYNKFNNSFSSTISINEIVENVNLISKKFALEPLFLVTSIADYNFTNKVFEKYNLQFPSEKSHFIELTKTNQLPELFNQFKFAIVNRMHCGIISMSYKIPTAMFPWQGKINGLLENIYSNEGNKYCYNDINLSSEEIISIFTDFNIISFEESIKNIKIKLLNTSLN